MSAAFSSNRCLWRGCDRVFSNLYDLIEHVEDLHIETDTAFLEIQENSHPPALPLSYVCRFYPPGHSGRRQSSSSGESTTARKARCAKRRSSWDSDPVFSDDSDEDESWAQDYKSQGVLASLGSEIHTGKPFICPVPGCRKRYKNINGMKYHSKHGHPGDTGRGRCGKLYSCRCGRTYKSSTALRHHCLTQHGEFPTPVTPTTPSAATPTSPLYVGMPAPPYVIPQPLPPAASTTAIQRTVVHVPLTVLK